MRSIQFTQECLNRATDSKFCEYGQTGPHGGRIVLIRALDKHRWFAPVALALTFGVLYLSTPTWDYHADGVAYAFNIEHVYRSGRLYTRLIHQNHLLYSVFGYFAYGAALLFSDDVRALRVLQCCSAVFGALGVFATYQLARSYLQSAASGLLTAACLGVLAGWWRTSTDADVYIVSATLVVSAAAIAARLPKLWPVGALVMATSMLTHQLAALGLLAVAFVVFSHSAGGLKQRVFKSAGFCFVSCTVTVFVYSMCATWGGYASTPAEVVLWAISNQGDFHFVLDPVANLAPAFKANVRLVVAWDLGLFQRTAGAVEYTALAMSGVCLIVSTWLGFNLVTNRQGEWRLQLPPGLAMLCLLWTAPFLMFLLVWEPYLTVYRVFYAPIVVIAIIGIVESVPGGGKSSAHISRARRDRGARLDARQFRSLCTPRYGYDGKPARLSGAFKDQPVERWRYGHSCEPKCRGHGCLVFQSSDAMEACRRGSESDRRDHPGSRACRGSGVAQRRGLPVSIEGSPGPVGWKRDFNRRAR